MPGPDPDTTDSEIRGVSAAITVRPVASMAGGDGWSTGGPIGSSRRVRFGGGGPDSHMTAFPVVKWVCAHSTTSSASRRESPYSGQPISPAPCGPKRSRRSTARCEAPRRRPSISSTRSSSARRSTWRRASWRATVPKNSATWSAPPTAQNCVVTGSTCPFHAYPAEWPSACSARCSTTWLIPATFNVSSLRPVAKMRDAWSGPWTSPASAQSAGTPSISPHRAVMANTLGGTRCPRAAISRQPVHVAPSPGARRRRRDDRSGAGSPSTPRCACRACARRPRPRRGSPRNVAPPRRRCRWRRRRA